MAEPQRVLPKTCQKSEQDMENVSTLDEYNSHFDNPDPNPIGDKITTTSLN